LELLGAGVSQEAVASALGVTASYISQLMADKDFAQQVADKRFTQLHQHTVRDNKYDTIEDRLLERMEQSLPMMIKPNEILRAIQVVNAAKRRGSQAQELPVGQHAQVVLNIPIKLVQKFTTNILNQVITVEGKDLITMPPQTLLKKVGATDERQQLTAVSEN
jgi:transcriptional regulator with XRE-family HTH domain